MQGTIHPYYAVALAPAIAAIVAITGALLRAERRTAVARVVAACSSRSPSSGTRTCSA